MDVGLRQMHAAVIQVVGKELVRTVGTAEPKGAPAVVDRVALANQGHRLRQIVTENYRLPLTQREVEDSGIGRFNFGIDIDSGDLPRAFRQLERLEVVGRHMGLNGLMRHPGAYRIARQRPHVRWIGNGLRRHQAQFQRQQPRGPQRD